MRIWYVNHYAVPDSLAKGGRPQHIAAALAKHGHKVTVFAASQHHLVARPCGEIPFAKQASPEGYLFKTIATPAYSGNSLQRLKNMLAFARGMGKALAAEANTAEAPELIIVSSPHPFAWKHLEKRKTRTMKMVFEERDIWPESLQEINGTPRWHPLTLWLHWTVKHIARHADGVVSLLPFTEQRFRRLGLEKNAFAWISNGVDPEQWEKSASALLPAAVQEAFRHCRDQGKKVVFYAGSMGPPNALEPLLLLKDGKEKPYHIFLMGDGVSRQSLEDAAVECDYLSFLPPVSWGMSHTVMKAADILYLSIGNFPNLYKYGIAMNKVFDYMMAAKPIVQVLQGGNHPVMDSGAGLELKKADPVLIDDALRHFAAMDEKKLAFFGDKGRQYVLKNHNWRDLGARYAEFCESVVNQPDYNQR